MGRDKERFTTVNRNDMFKNCVIILLAGLMLTSCKMSFSAVTPTQNYNANITIYDIPVEDCKK